MGLSAGIGGILLLSAACFSIYKFIFSSPKKIHPESNSEGSNSHNSFEREHELSDFSNNISENTNSTETSENGGFIDLTQYL
jgi:hypothetical protein